MIKEYRTVINGHEIVFSETCVRVGDFDFYYEEMSHIKHRSGQRPAYSFEYLGQRIFVPYNPKEERIIASFFKYAQSLNPQEIKPATKVKQAAEKPVHKPLDELNVKLDVPKTRRESARKRHDRSKLVTVDQLEKNLAESRRLREEIEIDDAKKGSKKRVIKRRTLIILIALVILLAAGVAAAVTFGVAGDADKPVVPAEEMTQPGTDYPETDSGREAVEKANDYLDYGIFSKASLMDQLMSDGYDENAAGYAVNACSADWNEMAVKKAEDYKKFTSFAKEDLQNQLLYDGFTKEQAEYAVNEIYK